MKSPDSPRPTADPPQAVPDPLFGHEKPTHPESAAAATETASGPASAPNRQLKVGGNLAGYRLVKKLGEGGMGIVFAAEDIRLKRRVALKLMKPEVAAKEQHRQRFLREAQAAAAVEHDHIVPIFQIGEDNGIPFIAMPFLKGEPLDVRLKRLRLSIPEIITIVRQTAEGLAAAHEKGLIHRDIKPGNIWLETTSDGGHRVKILDFGLARISSDSQQLTHSGAVMGTPAYMAPEQARGRPLDHRADLFSLGCILYEMTVGKRPFTGADTMSILTSLALDTPPNPRSLNPAVPPQLSQLIMRMLEKDPTNRPATAREVADEIRKLQPENMVVVVAPALPVEETNPWADIDAQSLTEVPLAEPESSVMSLGPDPALDSTPSGARSAARSASRRTEAVKSSESRAGYSSRSLKQAGGKRVSAAMIWLIGGGALAVALIVATLIILANNNRRDHKDGDGKAQNNIPVTPSAIENFALEFDGKTSVVEVATLSFQDGPYTLEAWITPVAASGENGLIIGLAARLGGAGIALEQSGDRWQGVVTSTKGNANIQSADNTAQAGKRVHVAFVWNGTTASLFVDGKKSPDAAGKPPHVFGTTGTTIGAYVLPPAALDRPFAGKLDEIRISKNARYDKDFAPQSRFDSDRNTLTLYHCDEGQGALLKDVSPFNNSGKVSGVKWVKPE